MSNPNLKISDHSRPRGFRLQANEDGSALTLDIFGTIGDPWDPEGVLVADVAKAIAPYGEADEIVVRINSFGGFAEDGIAIHNLLKSHPADVTVEVIAIAASAASVIAMAGDTIRIASNASIMIHNAWMITIGNAHDHEATVEQLNKLDQRIADTYAARTKVDSEKALELMAAETFMNADEAVDMGFADEIDEQQRAAAASLSAIELFRDRGLRQTIIQNRTKDMTMPKTDDDNGATPDAKAELRNYIEKLGEVEGPKAFANDTPLDEALASQCKALREQIETLNKAHAEAIDGLKAEHAGAINAKDEKIAELETKVKNAVKASGEDDPVKGGNDDKTASASNQSSKPPLMDCIRKRITAPANN